MVEAHAYKAIHFMVSRAEVQPRVFLIPTLDSFLGSNDHFGFSQQVFLCRLKGEFVSSQQTDEQQGLSDGWLEEALGDLLADVKGLQ